MSMQGYIALEETVKKFTNHKGGGGGVTNYGPLKPPARKVGDSLSNKMFFRKEA